MWGILPAQHQIIVSMRFIPTCVGNTASHRIRFGTGFGSSPRVWGIRLAAFADGMFSRFIPTCVGNT